MRTTVHIAGIGGVGMSAIAQALLDRGVMVSGSDRLWDNGQATPVLRCLQRQGVALLPQDGSAITASTVRLVVSSAIETDNPEVARAQALDIEIVHRATELARLVAGHTLVAVTGTSGKSSVTALLGHLLAAAGFDPLVINGAAVAGWDADGKRIGSVRNGGQHWAVIEADESDRSLMTFKPQHVVITNVSADHFSADEADALFDAFSAAADGCIIDGRQAPLHPTDARLANWQGSFTFEGHAYTVPLPGMHNIYNAWQAVRMARALGAPTQTLQTALAQFGGIERRLQRIGHCGTAVVIDDYAHNPEKLAAAWQTVAQAFPAGVCGVWRPHGYGPLRKMLADLSTAFAEVCRQQDQLLLLPVYDVGGSADRSINSDLLASKLAAKGVKVSLIQDLAEAERIMRAQCTRAGALVTLGARDPGLAALAKRLANVPQ